MKILELEELEQLKSQNKFVVNDEVDLSECSDLPDWIGQFIFKNKLIIPTNCDLYKLPRNMENTDLCIGGKEMYVINETRENLKGIPVLLQSLFVQSNLISTEGLMGVAIHSHIVLSVHKTINFSELPYFMDEIDEMREKRVILLGMYYPKLVANRFYEYYPECEKEDGTLEEKIERLCSKHYTQQILDSF